MPAIITEWQDGVTDWSAATMNVPIALLDKYVAQLHNLIVSCDGEITFNEVTGNLAWSAPLRIVFINAVGVSALNTVAMGNITVGANQYFYVDLNQTDGTTVIAGVATLTNGIAAVQKAVARLVLGYRNAVSGAFYPVALANEFGGSSGGVLNNYSATTDPTVNDDAVVGYAETSEWVNTTTSEIFKCIDATAANAVWESITASSTIAATGVTVDTTTFTTNLSAADDTVQKALETLDDLVVGGDLLPTGYYETEVGPVDASSGTANIDYSAGNVQRVTIGAGVSAVLTFINLPTGYACSATLRLELAGAVPASITLQGVTINTTGVTSAGEIIVEAQRIGTTWYLGVHHAS